MLETWAGRTPGEPFIGLTSEKLGGEKMYWQHRGRLSVITTDGLSDLSPINRYDYLAYCMVVQGIAIHLESQSAQWGRDQWGTNKASSGDVLTIAAPFAGFKGTILAGRLSPRDREMLLRCFGPVYLKDCTDLLTLDWLHTGRVAANLEQYYGVKFTPAATIQPTTQH
jgi:hypothetical protein